MCELECWYICTGAETFFQKEASAEKVISPKRLSAIARKEESGDLQIWHSRLVSKSTVFGTPLKGLRTDLEPLANSA